MIIVCCYRRRWTVRTFDGHSEQLELLDCFDCAGIHPVDPKFILCLLDLEAGQSLFLARLDSTYRVLLKRWCPRGGVCQIAQLVHVLHDQLE